MLDLTELRNTRLRALLTQEAFANKANIATSTYSKIERGSVEPKESEVDAIKETVENIDRVGITAVRVGQGEDVVNNPSHYADREYEVIDVLEDTLTEEQFEGYLAGNIIKYTMRWDKKGNAEQDLMKAEWYLKRLIDTLKKENGGI